MHEYHGTAIASSSSLSIGRSVYKLKRGKSEKVYNSKQSGAGNDFCVAVLAVLIFHSIITDLWLT